MPMTFTAPPELRAAEVTWNTVMPITSPPAVPFPTPPQGFRRTLIDLLRVIPSGPVASVPTFTAGAVAVPHARGVAKTASTLAFGGNSETLVSVATVVTVTDELVEDATGLQAWLDAFLGYLVKAGEEKEILTGTSGFLTRTDIPAYAGSATGMPAILADMAGQAITASGGLEPDTYVVSSGDWATVMTTAGADPDASTLHGCAVIRSPVLTAGQALVGACQSAAVLLRNGGIVVEATQSHTDDFTKDLTEIRAASRIALGVLAPTAFVKKVA